ncbi:T9SS type A sorting domain-containing protein [Dokdonia pacifica]|uniref:Por secretion system C-terminal sorting domain-containing protein n=1 Tax=Dokdonia pacifica TaxID=1627892 RepID=A0A239DKT0_9FLAO|nr:T9SS type A sorting domain-containing protein [Dokdonia pacifica]SNS32809.1 Por secretion system C-terminal sorting domain-containing protein [Dokdonia pacifica]
MKRASTLLFFCLFILGNTFAQTNSHTHTCKEFTYKRQPYLHCQNSSHYNENKDHSKEMSVMDRFGNYYCTEILNAKDNITTQRRVSSGGHFNTFYDNTPSSFRLIIDQVFEDLEQLLVFQKNCDGNFPQVNFRIKVVDFSDEGTIAIEDQPLATGTALYPGSTRRGTIIRGDVWNKINLGTTYNTSTSDDGIIQINQNLLNNFYVDHFVEDLNNDGIMDVDGTNLSGELYDLYGIIQHEILHAMGFISFLDQNGNGTTSSNFISPFDTLLYNNTTPFIDTSTPYDWDISAGINPSVAFQDPCPTNTIQTTSHTFPLHSMDSDGNFVQPSHINDTNNCTNGVSYIMSPSYSHLEYKRLHHDEVSILNELGYQTTTTYGSEFLITDNATINPNRDINFPASTINMAYAIDDPCLEDSYFTFNECEGPSYEIDIIQNDIITSNYSIVNTEVINLLKPGHITIADNVQMEVQNNTNSITINYTDQMLLGREYKIRYQLVENTTGRLSNPALVTFKILPCSDHLVNFNCTPESTDFNLICNSEFITDYELPSHPLVFNNTFSSGIRVPYDFMPGWYPVNHNARYFFDIYTLADVVAHIPAITDDIVNNNGVFALEGTKGVMTKLTSNLQPDKRYIVSHFSKGLDEDNEAKRRYRIGFFEDIDQDTYYPDAPPQENSPSYLAQSVTNFTSTSDQISQHVYSFVADQEYEGTFVSARNSGFILFDHLELIEDTIEDIETEVEVDCSLNELTTIGTNLYTVRGMNFSWWLAGEDGVFYTNDDIQLTSNDTDLITSDTISPIGNGSELTIGTITSTETYQLRRTMGETTGLHYTEANGLIDTITLPPASTNNFIDNINVQVSCIEICEVDVYGNFDSADVTYADGDLCTAFPFGHFNPAWNTPFPWKATIYYAAYHVLLTEDFYDDYNCDILVNQGTNTNLWMKPHRIKTPPSGHESVMAYWNNSKHTDPNFSGVYTQIENLEPNTTYQIEFYDLPLRTHAPGRQTANLYYKTKVSFDGQEWDGPDTYYTNEDNYWHQRTMTFTTGPTTTATTLTLQFPLYPDLNNPVNDGYIAIDDIKITCVDTANVGENDTNIPSRYENTDENQVFIYPNPTKEDLFIELLDQKQEIKTIEIFNTHGHLVWKDEGNLNTITISKLKKGIYFIKILTSDNTYITEKIIKQ